MVPISERVNLTGKTAIVTGASRGIGACVAYTLAQEGANVVVSDVLPVDDTVQKIRESGFDVLGIRCDVTSPDDVENMIESTLSTFKGIDILVCNAGVITRGGLLDQSLENWNKVIEINLSGSFLTVQSVYRHMVKQRSGKIVCIGSVTAAIGTVVSSPSYVASKGAIHSFIRTVSKEAATNGINVNAVAPGYVNTDMMRGVPFNRENIPLRRLAEPEDIAQAVLFLSSPASNYITGQVLDVNGGVYLG